MISELGLGYFLLNMASRKAVRVYDVRTVSLEVYLIVIESQRVKSR